MNKGLEDMKRESWEEGRITPDLSTYTACAKALRPSVLAARRPVGQKVRWGRSWEPLLVGFEKFVFAAIFSISTGQKQGDQGVG